MITKWNFQTPTEEELHKRDRLASQLGLSPVVCLLLVQRGLTTVEEVKKFFKPSLNDLHDPFLMPDMEKAVKRLNKALGNKEKILIYGDYDVDGTTAVSLVYKYLRPYSSALDYYIPDRYDEGYGISYKGINYARENGITLVISLDCGIKAIEKIEYAKQLGIDFIICDHHMPDDTLPDAVAVLDAKRVDSVYPYEHRRVQVHAGIRQKQQLPVCRPGETAGADGGQHRLGHRPHHRRKPHIGLLRPEAA